MTKYSVLIDISGCEIRNLYGYTKGGECYKVIPGNCWDRTMNARKSGTDKNGKLHTYNCKLINWGLFLQ